MIIFIVIFGFFFGVMPAILTAPYNLYADRSDIQPLEKTSWLDNRAGWRNARLLRKGALRKDMGFALIAGLIFYRFVFWGFFLSVAAFFASFYPPLGLSPL